MTTNAIDPTKAALRHRALARRRESAPAAREGFSTRLTREGLRLARLWRPKSVSAFFPIQSEPDTLALLEALAAEGFATALPVTISRESPLVFRQWRPGEPTVPGEMNIPEPPPSAPALDPDLLFVPLAVFDRRGHRIGYGAGHYDRTLQRLRAMKPIRAVGIAYSVCETEAIPVEPHDQPLDFILTENELIEIQGSA